MAIKTQTKLTPALFEISAGRDVILTVNGKPVVYLKASEVRTRTAFMKEDYDYHEYCGMGITVKNRVGLAHEYVSGCATTENLQVEFNSVTDVTKAAADRYQIQWQ